MVTQNERQVAEFAAMGISEMMQIHGGAQVDYFLKLDGVDGESTSAASLWGQGKIVRIDFCK